MSIKSTFVSWISISVLLLCSHSISAQCNPPTTLWLHAPQTSTSFTLNWSNVSGVSQYDLLYWETSTPGDKTILENAVPAPFTLSGLKKSTQYSLQIRSRCGSSNSVWGTAVNYLTSNDPGSCATPTGVNLSTGPSSIAISWTSTGSHTIRYRLGISGDWFIPSNGLSVSNSPYTIPGGLPGAYQIQVKRNCSGTSSDFINAVVTLGGACSTPVEPTVISGSTSASVDLPGVSGITGYMVEYRLGTTGNWISVGANIPPSNYSLNPPLLPSTQYQVRIKAVCGLINSEYSPVATFTTQPIGSCLVNKNYGKNLSAEEIIQINNKFNVPSPFTFGGMIGVNDGGLVFRSFQNEISNQITQLATQFRNFHTMDEDFDNSLVNYDQNIKPKNTIPEGTPANTGYNKSLYNIYHNTHGFANITAATELLQYEPQSWKEKIYKESDWSMSGPSGIKNSFENYTKKFIDEFAPVNSVSSNLHVSNFQVGNELWDYPVKEDYHNLLTGAWSAFVNRYGGRSSGGWKMKLVAGAFQAYRDNNCASMSRDFSNCDGDLGRHDFIGDYLDVPNCDVLKDLDAVDCHPYSFIKGTTRWAYPEDPQSEGWQIRNLAAWLDINRNSVTGVLRNTHAWATEYGFDSNPLSGVGEKTHNAYLIRGLLLHSRFHFEKVFFYNAFDVSRPSDQYYTGLYNSSGFWKLGTHPTGGWASPLEANGAQAKPAWYGMLDLKTRFGNHVFYKALVEDSEAYVVLIAKPDGTDPYLVFWAPLRTTDSDINAEIPLIKALNWSGVLAGDYKIGNNLMGQTFAENNTPGYKFKAFTGAECGTTLLSVIRRNPTFIPLISCQSCTNITNPGEILAPNPSSGNSPFDSDPISSVSEATGGTGGSILYQWQQSINNIGFTDIPGATALIYNPPSLTQTTYFRRGSKRTICSEFLYTAPVAITIIIGNSCPTVISFKRFSHNNAGCNSAGDYYFEVVVSNVTVNDQITIDELPENGLNVSLSTLNDVPFDNPGFHANLQYVNNSSLRWMINVANGSTQTVKIYYCWVNSYPEPVSASTATSLCSGQTTPAAQGVNLTDPGEERSMLFSQPISPAFKFSIQPNPGGDQITLTYFGAPALEANLHFVSVMGQWMNTQYLTELDNQQQWLIETGNLPSGSYFLHLQIKNQARHVLWIKY